MEIEPLTDPRRDLAFLAGGFAGGMATAIGAFMVLIKYMKTEAGKQEKQKQQSI